MYCLNNIYFFTILICAELTGQWNYIIDIIVNTPNAENFEQLGLALNVTRLPIRLNNSIDISDVSITTGE